MVPSSRVRVWALWRPSQAGAVLQGFCQVLPADIGLCLQIGQGAGDLQHAVRRAQRQGQAFAGSFQPSLVVRGQPTVGAQAGQVEKRIGHALARHLDVPGRRDPGSGRGRVVSGQCRCVQGGGLAGDGDVQVDAVQQRAGELSPVALDLLRGAPAAAAGVPEKAARAGVHGGDQLEARRKTHGVAGPGDDDMPALQRLAQHLQDLAIELGQLIQKKHTVVRQGDFPGLWATASRGNRNRLDKNAL